MAPSGEWMCSGARNSENAWLGMNNVFLSRVSRDALHKHGLCGGKMSDR